MTISVNLSGEHGAFIKADTCGENSTDVDPFITVDIGLLNIILASAEQSRKLAGELHRAADKLDGLAKRPAQPMIHDEVTL